MTFDEWRKANPGIIATMEEEDLKAVWDAAWQARGERDAQIAEADIADLVNSNRHEDADDRKRLAKHFREANP